MERLMTTEEVAEYLRVDVVTIRRLINRGELPAYRIGSEYRSAPSDLEEYLQRQRVPVSEGTENDFSLGGWIHKALQGKQTTPADFVKRDRFDRFTDQARRVLQFSQEEAQRFRHTYIGTEHLLLGLLRESDGVAAQVLDNLGVELTIIRDAVETIIGHSDRIIVGPIGLTPRAKKVIELAVDEARRLDHHYIGTEHILLGLLREGEGIAAGVLEKFGVKLDQTRAEIRRVLELNKTNTPEAPATKPDPSQAETPQKPDQQQKNKTIAIPSIPPEVTSLLVGSGQGLTCSNCGTVCPLFFRHCFNCGHLLDRQD